MSVTKIKIVYEDDIRMLKLKESEISIGKIKEFIKKNHKELEEFRLLFKDEEEDEITIVDNDDLKEALNSNSKATKIYVKPINRSEEKERIETSSDNDTSSEDSEETESEDEDENDVEEENNCESRGDKCKWLKFLDDISEDNELKEEFISFLKTFILSLQNEKNENNNKDTTKQQKGELNNGSELFIEALSLHKKLEKNEIINLFIKEKLNILFYQFPHLLKILKHINVNDINKFIDLIIQFHKNNKLCPRRNNFRMLPGFLFPFFGLFNCRKNKRHCKRFGPPMFGMFHGFRGGKRCHRGRHHKFGRKHHHHHKHGHKHGYGHKHGHRHNHHSHHSHHGHHNNVFRFKFNKFGKEKDLRADIIDENITLGKNAFVNGNETLIKTWKIKNVGKKDIPENCIIQYFGKRFNPMIDGTKFELKNKIIKINEEFECSVVVKSPKKNGRYTSKWKLITKDGKRFGQALFVSFIVNDDNNKSPKLIKKEEKKLFKQEKKLLKKEEKLERKKEKLRIEKEELLKKLQELEKETNNLNDNNDNEEKEIVNDNNIIIEEQEKDNEDVFIVEETFENNNNFIYEEELNQLKSMGFNDENQLKKLLETFNGNVQQVLNQIIS